MSAETEKRRIRDENNKAYQIWVENLNERIREDRKIRENQEVNFWIEKVIKLIFRKNVKNN